MFEELFNFLLEVPQALANFGTWLITPISEQYLNISPLGLLGVSGTAIVISLILVHVVKLFLP